MWEGNKRQAGSLKSIIFDEAKLILGCSKNFNGAIRENMGLDTVQSRSDKAKLKWWYKLVILFEDRYHKQEWNFLFTMSRYEPFFFN